MDYRAELDAVREKIDAIDKQMLSLFEQRMQISNQVADIKSKSNISLVDEKRETAIVERAVADMPAQLKGETTVFLRSLMGLSKSRQRKCLYGAQEELLMPKAAAAVTQDIQVAYQGVPGAWGEQAALQAFPNAQRSNMETFEDVFIAVKDKKVHYGVLPVENSQSGAIGEVYDLLRKYGCYIVGQTWVPVHHCLMGVQGAQTEDVREVFSHPEGFKQCSKFLRGRAWDLTACRNTAVAAEKVAKLAEKRYAAIGSPRAAQLNGLQILAKDIVSDDSNKTRFIVIADAPQYTQESDTVSLIFRTAHRSGALCDVLFAFMSENINITRIESRPVADGKYCFFVDAEGNVEDPHMASALQQASACCGFLEVLGCYTTESKK
ncbi:MAG: prephenate dehydratase domain-containing protein [Oscillospiraceae bacterium]|nr:prephenate dehydratase domain-containing protein [Oscillospiraceae bacterium]